MEILDWLIKLGPYGLAGLLWLWKENERVKRERYEDYFLKLGAKASGVELLEKK